MRPAEKQSGYRHKRESSPGAEGRHRSQGGPQRPCNHTGQQYCDADDEIEYPESRTAKIGRRPVGHHFREQSLAERHVQTPKGRAHQRGSGRLGYCQDKIGENEQRKSEW